MKMKKITFRRLISILLLAAGSVSLFFGIRSFGGSGIGKPYDARQGIVLVRAMVSNAAREQDGPWALPGSRWSIS